MAPQSDARSGPLNSLLIAADRTLAAEFVASLAPRRAFQILADLKTYPTRQLFEIRLRQLQPHAVLLDVSSDLERASEIMRAAAARQVPVVALHRTSDPEAILRAVRLGASEFLHPPFDPQVQEQAVARIRRMIAPQQPESRRELGKVVVFTSAKPGSGASTLAAQTAFAVRRLTGARVLLADLDLMDATVSFYLRLQPGRALIDVLGDDGGLEEWPSLVESAQGLDVLGAPDFPSGETVEPPRLSEFLERARQLYPWTILDLPAVFHRLSLLALSQSELACIVSSAELPSLHLARKAVALLARIGFGPDRFQVLINRVPADAGLRAADMAKIVASPVNGRFPNDFFAVERAVTVGEPLDPACALGRAIEEFARELTKSTAP